MKREPQKPQTTHDDVPDKQLAPFLREIADRFLSRQTNQFLLTGNVSDLVDGAGVLSPWSAKEHPARYGAIEAYIQKRLTSRGRAVVTFDIARGIRFQDNDAFNALRAYYAEEDAAGPIVSLNDQTKRAQRFDRTVAESQVYSFLTLKFLEELCRLARRRAAGPVANGLTIVLLHAEMLLPDAPLAQMSEIDRQKLTLLTEWFRDPDFLASNEQVILIAPTMAGVHEALRTLPHMAAIEIPRPAADARGAFIAWMHAQTGQSLRLSKSQKELAEMTAGMTLLTLQGLFLQARYRDGVLDEKDLIEALNRLLVSELGDKIEVKRPRHTMADVIGAEALKKELSRLKKLLDARDAAVAPVGILVAGPNGVGKTFIFEAWAADCDRLVIELKNLRGMYFGQTDQIFEKLKSVLEALGNVIVFIDEADTMFGRPGRDTHETEARLFGNLIRMMGDPKNRGRIVWILLTARPDNLAPDLKRSGRAGLHLPVFDPEGDDRRAHVAMLFKRAGFDASTLSEEQKKTIDVRTAELSPADFNELLTELRAERNIAGELKFEQVMAVVDNLMPGQIADQRRLQTLNALLECSRKSIVPPSLRDLSRADVEREIEMLRRRLG